MYKDQASYYDAFVIRNIAAEDQNIGIHSSVWINSISGTNSFTSPEKALIALNLCHEHDHDIAKQSFHAPFVQPISHIIKDAQQLADTIDMVAKIQKSTLSFGSPRHIDWLNRRLANPILKFSPMMPMTNLYPSHTPAGIKNTETLWSKKLYTETTYDFMSLFSTDHENYDLIVQACINKYAKQTKHQSMQEEWIEERFANQNKIFLWKNHNSKSNILDINSSPNIVKAFAKTTFEDLQKQDFPIKPRNVAYAELRIKDCFKICEFAIAKI